MARAPIAPKKGLAFTPGQVPITRDTCEICAGEGCLQCDEPFVRRAMSGQQARR